ncbi:hypothetical protein MLD38_021001 [Melastoma candidum]|uniref:Uncharacterized protein n=1 Tax=Melastoma candidum TaxID=119954 RepID=A0ACB9QI45_9MYRT|nr:hypothetical protein MLD38_021001 [Melastoma candidum]
MATSQHRCVFVGNIPYDATEEQLIEICQEVGPVVSFRLVTDRETGKPKGYGFCEYKDEETALSARRNLQGYDINGRQLRVDFAENDKGSDRSREQGRGGQGLAANADNQKQAAVVAHGDASSGQPIGLQTATAAAAVMTGALGGPQVGSFLNENGFQSHSTIAGDPLTLHLANMSKNQLSEVLSELKGFATRNKESARKLLHSRSQLAKALFQAEIMLGMLQMPNLRQPLQTALVESQVMCQAAISASSRLPPLAHRMDSALTDIHGQMPIVVPGSIIPSQFSRPAQPPVLPQFQLMPHKNFPQGELSGVNLGEASQIGLASKPMLTSLLPHQSGIDPHFQAGPSGVSDGRNSNAGLGQVYMDASVSRSDQYRHSDAVPEVDMSLLQQVLSLTAEQLNTLPPEQRQQVLQLQQKLRQGHQQIDEGGSRDGLG